MPTRDEAAEALYRAARPFRAFVDAIYDSGDIDRMRARLAEALDAYSASPPFATPSPLPAEVARVLVAAMRFVPLGQTKPAFAELRDAVDAYRDYLDALPQPEPLSARLAKLKAGSVVVREGNDGRTFTVIANDGAYLWTQPSSSDGRMTLPYAAVASIISEVA